MEPRRSKAAGRRLGKICGRWFPIHLRHGGGTMWWCEHNIGIVDLAAYADFEERHAEIVQRVQEYERLGTICHTFLYRNGVHNPGDGWYCAHGFLIATLSELALENLAIWHASYLKDKRGLCQDVQRSDAGLSPSSGRGSST